jgi:hypothetical protein
VEEEMNNKKIVKKSWFWAVALMILISGIASCVEAKEKTNINPIIKLNNILNSYPQNEINQIDKNTGEYFIGYIIGFFTNFSHDEEWYYFNAKTILIFEKGNWLNTYVNNERIKVHKAGNGLILVNPGFICGYSVIVVNY